ncbi:hypothetical protein E2I00_017300 [Balaenoptera physalus]|uniref:Uncharacterized protein n=1 Tax=Balaenoptera physalus TaxID=9770 RepID=A0A643BUN3_BALPH|nr:hypothetical protein E2I00_017300 [Balaenoptera physalus]
MTKNSTSTPAAKPKWAKASKKSTDHPKYSHDRGCHPGGELCWLFMPVHPEVHQEPLQGG